MTPFDRAAMFAKNLLAENGVQINQVEARAVVSAVLEGIRDPSKEMVDAAYDAHDAFEKADTPAVWCGAKDAYQAMIDKALEEWP